MSEHATHRYSRDLLSTEQKGPVWKTAVKYLFAAVGIVVGIKLLAGAIDLPQLPQIKTT